MCQMYFFVSVGAAWDNKISVFASLTSSRFTNMKTTRTLADQAGLAVYPQP